METGQLAAALRNKAADVRNVNVAEEHEYQVLRDAADLLRVLAHVVDGKPLTKAFGSPGDWGYETEIGAAIAAAPVTPNGEVRGASRLAGEASSREAATSTVVLEGTGGKDTK